MILSKVYEDAEHRLERNEITLGEFERLVDIEVIEPKRGKPDFADCEKCSRTYGTLGCCSTVSNEWIYSCLEGMLEKAYADGIKSVEPKRGKWIVHKERTEVNDGFIDFFPTEYECSNCGLKQSMYFINSKPSNFCPNCGADMRKESE